MNSRISIRIKGRWAPTDCGAALQSQRAVVPFTFSSDDIENRLRTSSYQYAQIEAKLYMVLRTLLSLGAAAALIATCGTF